MRMPQQRAHRSGWGVVFAVAFATCFSVGACVQSSVVHNDSDGVAQGPGVDGDSDVDDANASPSDSDAGALDTDDASRDVADDATASSDTSRDVGGGGARPDLPFVPAPVMLHRLTASQYRATVRDVFGLDVSTELEVDTALHGFVSVAATELTISPRAMEQLEDAAWEVALRLTSDPAARAGLLGCALEDGFDACLVPWIERTGMRAWRRPLSGDEVQLIRRIATSVADEHRDPWMGVAAAISMMMQSPYFVYRVEEGEPHPTRPEWRRYTNWEMASRVSYLLWGTAPDDLLLDAAGRGELTTDAGLVAEVRRMLDDPRARPHLESYFSEFVGLDRLQFAVKDAELFPEMNDALRDGMLREVAWLFGDLVFEKRGDIRDLLTTRQTYVNEELAALYGIEAPVPGGFGEAFLLDEEQRGGLLGRAALLSIYAHATVNSPTLRGRFVRARLMCQDVPPPPEGVVTELPEPPEGVVMTLRDRLAIHREDRLCAGCHDVMDPIGFALEHFDPIGRVRDNDNGLPIDATGFLEGRNFDGAVELGDVLAENPAFIDCMTRRLYRYATGHLETAGELGVILDLRRAFVASGHRFDDLLVELVLSDGFRYASAPINGDCDSSGETRACETACGIGEERCADGRWVACDAPAPEVEICNNLDDDCDGFIDEGLVEPCDGTACGPGTRTCVAGVWGECDAPTPSPEVCNGRDDDCDGRVDEDVPAERREVSFVTLATQHDGCNGFPERIGPRCNAAIHRYCGGELCSITGFGPLESGPASISVACLPADLAAPVTTSFTTLGAHHPGCHGGTEDARYGPNCNAAVHRFCAARGDRTGYGPVESSGDRADVVCVPAATVVESTYTELSGRHENCTRDGERMGPNCNAAIHRLCVARGFVSGFGPLENSGDLAYVACVPPRP